MTSLKNDTFLRALLKQPVEYTPIWMMRQAGRYLPEYKATRAKAGSFLDLCKNTELATEVTIQPLDRFDLDAAILFSDILTVPDAMGLGLYFAEGEGPKFERALQHEMVEGGSSKEFRTIKTMMYSRPDLLHKILDTNAQAVTAYLNAQIDAGAQAVQIFDTWGGVLSDAAFKEFSLKYIRQIVAGLKRESEGRRVPVIVFAKGGGLWLEGMAEIGADALGLDWTCNIGEARRRVGDQVALQGNFDPFALFGTPESIRTEVARILADYGHGSGHVFNLGHGINQHADPEHAKILVDTVHELSRQYHA